MAEQRLTIFGAIGSAVTTEGIAMQLGSMDRNSPLIVEINSEGGSVSEGIGIFNLLASWPGGVDTQVVGWALSIASLILMAGSKRTMHETSLLMVHAPWVNATGNAGGLRQAADTLDQVAETMRRAYMRTGQPEAVVATWLDGADHWFTSDESLAMGLVTEVVPAASAPAAAPVNAHACRFPIPSNLIQRIQAMPQQQNNAASVQASIQAERQRCLDITNALQPLASRADIGREVTALIQASIANPSCNVHEAKAKLLDLMGRGATPAAGSYYVPTHDHDSRSREFAAACTDALLIRAGLQVKEAHPAMRDVQRMSVIAMAESFLSLQGHAVAGMNRNEILNAALSPNAGLSTSDFTKLLSGVAGKALQQGYQEAPATHSIWTGEREVADFKKQTLVALSDVPGLLQVPEGGEYKFGSLSDSASEFSLATFGRIITLTRQAIVNDDLSAFTNLPASFGAAARRLEADKVYGVLQTTSNLGDGVPLFHASRGNLAAAGSALTVANLGNARAEMRKQRGIAAGGSDKTGSYIDPQPRYLVVPVALETAGESIISSLVDYRVTSMGATRGEEVQWIRKLTLVADPRLDEVSSTAWYLAADPRQIEGIVRAYLQGESRPHLDENDEFIRDAVSYKTRLDFAAGVIDYRALYKNPGV
jgi:ATP-dependent protease ClpP protease subunit